MNVRGAGTLCSWVCGALLATAAVAAPPDFPERVPLPTPTEAEGLREVYAVRDGRLWVRNLPAGTWALFEATGTPPDAAAPVRAVYADDTHRLLVVTADGFLHHHENDGWQSLWGLPVPLVIPRAPLRLPPGVTQLAYSMRHASVQYYEDPRGNQFHWGTTGTSTVYALSADGTRILLADPWLSPDFSREVPMPNADTRAVAIAASASTLFIMADDGALYTRFFDYDSNGGTPFYAYAYGDVPPHALPGAAPSSEMQTRALPPEPWRAQPRVPDTEALAHHHIAIVQTGTGNAARELRVQGSAASGDAGYFKKALDDAAWTFVPAQLIAADDAWRDCTPPPKAGSTTPPRSYRGFMVTRLGARARDIVELRTDDFSFHASPMHLTLSLSSGATVTLRLELVDAWAMFAEPNAVEDPNAYKKLKATVLLPDGLSAQTRALLARALGPSFTATFAFAVVANQQELVLTPTGYPFDSDAYRIVLRANPALRARRAVALTPFSRLAATEVDLRGVADLTTCARSEALRAQALRALRSVEEAHARAEGEQLQTRTSGAILHALTVALDGVSVLTTTRFWLEPTRWLSSYELHLPAMSAAANLAQTRLITQSEGDYARTTRALARCTSARTTR